MNNPVIYPIDLPVSSLTVALSGEADLTTSGFIYSPTGGVFASGSTSGYTAWSYSFIILPESQIFSIKTYDASGYFSDEITQNISYQLPPPVIIYPGTVKTLIDNIAASGSTDILFKTLSGQFKNDGVIIGDKVLAISGKNINQIKAVSLVDNLFINTDNFTNAWNIGDKIKIYPETDRPSFTTNNLIIDSSGICSNESLKVIYSNCDFEEITLYTESNSTTFNFTSLNNTLHVKINNIEKTIIFNLGVQTIADVVAIINSYFPDVVAYEDDAKFYLRARYIKVYATNSELGIAEGEYLLSLKISVDTFKITEQANSFFDITVDGKNIKINFNLEVDYTKDFLLNKINELSNKKIAFYLPTGIAILGLENILFNKDVPDISLTKSVLSIANYTQGLQDWNLSFNIIKSLDTLKVFALDVFYRLTPSSDLGLIYKIAKPVLSTTTLTVSQNIIDLVGTYDITGLDVKVNSILAYSAGGSWKYTLDNLTDGENQVSIITEDVFGGTSDELSVVVTYNNPENVLPPDPISPTLQWKHKQNPSLAPEDLQHIIEFIDNSINSIVTALALVNRLLNLAKAWITDALSPLAALRAAIQQFIDKITDLINQIVVAEGLYILEVIPTKEYLKNNSFFDFCSGGFDEFLNKISQSFDDYKDDSRPQLNENSYVGGMILAVDSGDGVNSFIETLSSLKKLITSKILDVGLSAPQNLQAVGENKRVVITWSSPEGLLPSVYEIYRYDVPGGNIQTKKVKSNVTNKGDPVYTEETVTDANGQPLVLFGAPDGSPLGKPIGTMVDPQILKDFKFIDGKESTAEKENQDFVQKWIINPTSNFLNGITEFVLVNTESTGVDLENNKQHYYRVVPRIALTETRGESYEISATPNEPTLEEVEEDLSDQIEKATTDYEKNKKNEETIRNLVEQNSGTAPKKNPVAYSFRTSKSIYDKDTGAYILAPYSSLTITADNVNMKPSTQMTIAVMGPSGVIFLDNAPKEKIVVKYWTKKEIPTTRARLEGTVRGGFTIKPDFASVAGGNVNVSITEAALSAIGDSNNSLEIQVGKGASLLKSIGGPSISLSQKVTFVRKFPKQGSKFLTADEAASILRSQLSGVKVYVSPRNTIIIEDDNNPDIYQNSYLKIIKGNKTLGFTMFASEEKFSSTGTSNYQSEGGFSSGTPPDWYSIRVGDLFPSLSDLLRYIENVLKQFLSSLESATKSLTDFIELLQTKVAALSAMAEELRQLLKDLTDILKIKGGVYFLEIPTKKGGADYFKTTMYAATGRPLKSDYSAGIVLLYSSTRTAQAMQFLFKSMM